MFFGVWGSFSYKNFCYKKTMCNKFYILHLFHFKCFRNGLIETAWDSENWCYKKNFSRTKTHHQAVKSTYIFNTANSTITLSLASYKHSFSIFCQSSPLCKVLQLNFFSSGTFMSFQCMANHISMESVFRSLLIVPWPLVGRSAKTGAFQNYFISTSFERAYFYIWASCSIGIWTLVLQKRVFFRQDLEELTYLSLFHIKITASITKNSYQDCDPCYLHMQWILILMNSEGTKRFCSI